MDHYVCDTEQNYGNFLLGTGKQLLRNNKYGWIMNKYNKAKWVSKLS